MSTSHSGQRRRTPGSRRKLRPARTNATKQKLFEASMELIGERGAAGVTVDEIAAAAGVSKGTVYYNFGSKSDLIAQLLRHGVDILMARLLSVRDDSADPLAAMDEMIGQAMDFMAEYPSFARLWVSENWRTPSEWQDTFAELRGPLLAVIGAAIDAVAAKSTPWTRPCPAAAWKPPSSAPVLSWAWTARPTTQSGPGSKVSPPLWRPCAATCEVARVQG